MSNLSSTPGGASKPRKRFQRCIIHIGTEKTGTSAIQNYLGANRKALMKSGTLYPVAAGSPHLSQWEFVAAVHPAPWEQDVGRAFDIYDAAGQAAFRAHLRRQLELEFFGVESETLLISSEHFHSRLVTPVSIAALKSFLDPWAETFQVLVYFRRQDEVALSHQSTRLKSSVPLPEFGSLEEMIGHTGYYSYDRIFLNWAGVFGKEAVGARLYNSGEGADNVVADFCLVCGIPISDAAPERMNPSLNRKGFQFLRAVNTLFPTTPGDENDEQRTALIQEISSAYSGKFYPFNREESEAFYERFKVGNERLRILAFPNRDAPLFDEDFSEYPIVAESRTPNYSDAVEIAYHLWGVARSQAAERDPGTRTLFLKRLLKRMTAVRQPKFPVDSSTKKSD